jgi:hypothetical protein
LGFQSALLLSASSGVLIFLVVDEDKIGNVGCHERPITGPLSFSAILICGTKTNKKLTKNRDRQGERAKRRKLLTW